MYRAVAGNAKQRLRTGPHKRICRQGIRYAASVRGDVHVACRADRHGLDLIASCIGVRPARGYSGRAGTDERDGIDVSTIGMHFGHIEQIKTAIAVGRRTEPGEISSRHRTADVCAAVCRDDHVEGLVE